VRRTCDKSELELSPLLVSGVPVLWFNGSLKTIRSVAPLMICFEELPVSGPQYSERLVPHMKDKLYS